MRERERERDDIYILCYLCYLVTYVTKCQSKNGFLKATYLGLSFVTFVTFLFYNLGDCQVSD